MNHNPMNRRLGGNRYFCNDEGAFQTLPVHPRREDHDMPRGFGPEGGMGPRGGNGPHGGMGPGGGMPPHGGRPPRGGNGPRGGMPPHGGMGPGGMGPGGDMPHGGMRRPNPEFLKRRIEEADLTDLIEMAGRMVHRRPVGGPAAHGQALILSILAGRDALSQRQLQQMLGIQPGSLSEILTKLEGKGYLTREKAEDRRGNLLRITEAGREAMLDRESAPADDRFSALSEDQQDQLAGLLRTLVVDWCDRLETLLGVGHGRTPGSPALPELPPDAEEV